MNLFDKKFVHFEWDDSLEGKEGFFARDITTLKVTVNEGSVNVPAEIRCVYSSCSNGSLARPFHSEREEDNWVFFYHDPNYECKVAYTQGKTIQWRYAGKGEWQDTCNPCWDEWNYEYRVKPEKKWRPFKDIQELKEVCTRKYYKAWSHDYTLSEPMIWVRSKPNSACTRMLNGFLDESNIEEQAVSIGTVWNTMDMLFNEWEFLDHTPCGVEEEE